MVPKFSPSLQLPSHIPLHALVKINLTLQIELVPEVRLGFGCFEKIASKNKCPAQLEDLREDLDPTLKVGHLWNAEVFVVCGVDVDVLVVLSSI